MNRLLLLTFLFFVFFSGCENKVDYREQVDFWNAPDNNSVLYALSKNASEGVLPVSAQTKLEYVLSGLMDFNGYSLEISYILRGIPADGELAYIELGSVAWELPVDLSFLGIQAFPNTDENTDSILINYTVPLAQNHTENQIDRITVGWISANAESGGNSRRKNESNESNTSSIIIKKIALVRQWYGFEYSASNNTIRLSPFVYYSDNVLVIDPPQALYFNCDLITALEVSGRLTIETAANSGYFRIEGEARTITAPGSLLTSASFPVRISGSGIYRAELKESVYGASQRNQVQQMTNSATDILEPIPADPGAVLTWPRESFRDQRYEIFKWEEFPSILIFDFSTYVVQDNFVKRLAFYAEKAGFRGRLAHDQEIAGLHGWNAHDYKAETLANFFSLAETTNFPLLPEEKELEALLFHTGIILRDSGGKIVPGEGAIISISRESADYLRSTFMAHEGFHALFFIDSDFRDFCNQRWNALAPVPKAFLLSFFDYQAYDIRDQYLVVNEFMGHVMQQSVSQAGRYFGENIAARIHASERRRHVLPPRDESTETWPILANAFTAEAEAISRYVNRRWNLSAGRVHKLTFRR